MGDWYSSLWVASRIVTIQHSKSGGPLENCKKLFNFRLPTKFSIHRIVTFLKTLRNLLELSSRRIRKRGFRLNNFYSWSSLKDTRNFKHVNNFVNDNWVFHSFYLEYPLKTLNFKFFQQTGQRIIYLASGSKKWELIWLIFFQWKKNQKKITCNKCLLSCCDWNRRWSWVYENHSWLMTPCFGFQIWPTSVDSFP